MSAALDVLDRKVILTVTNAVGDKNIPSTATFDLAMLEALPQKSFTTMTPWGKAPISFTGPLLHDVLAAAKATGETITAAAINDYSIVIPYDDSIKFDVIVAHHMDNRTIPVRTKGPLFIVYPFDAKQELKSSVYYRRSVWQLKSLTIN